MLDVKELKVFLGEFFNLNLNRRGPFIAAYFEIGLILVGRATLLQHVLRDLERGRKVVT